MNAEANIPAAELKQRIMDSVAAHDRIVISRHIRPDGDAVGATLGLKGLLSASFPEKDIRVISEDHSEELAFLGAEDAQAEDAFYRDALVIVCDTGDRTRISNRKYALAQEIVKIDHHLGSDPYGTLNWAEPERSSVCEMIADLYASFRDRLVLTREAAKLIYAGMVTDSGRFSYDGTTGETLRLAAILLDTGFDLDTLMAQLYLDDYRFLKFTAYVYENMQRTENGVTYLFVDRAMQERFGLSLEQASDSVALLKRVRGGIVWLAFIEYPDSIRVRLRSRYVTVSELAERYRGGGHAKAAGATVYSREEMDALLKEADGIARAYKTDHPDCI